MAELRKIDIKEGKFECGGKMYYISETISFSRFDKLQEFIIEFMYSATPQDIFIGVRKAYDKVNERKDADAAVILHNILAGLENLEKKNHPALKICALFCNAEDEDMTIYSDAIIKSKIEAWSKELDVTIFFHFAASLCPEWIAALRIFTQTISGQEAKPEA